LASWEDNAKIDIQYRKISYPIDKRIALLASICLIVIVVAALVLFYTTKFSTPENKTRLQVKSF